MKKQIFAIILSVLALVACSDNKKAPPASSGPGFYGYSYTYGGFGLYADPVADSSYTRVRKVVASIEAKDQEKAYSYNELRDMIDEVEREWRNSSAYNFNGGSCEEQAVNEAQRRAIEEAIALNRSQLEFFRSQGMLPMRNFGEQAEEPVNYDYCDSSMGGLPAGFSQPFSQTNTTVTYVSPMYQNEYLYAGILGDESEVSMMYTVADNTCRMLGHQRADYFYAEYASYFGISRAAFVVDNSYVGLKVDYYVINHPNDSIYRELVCVK